MNGGFYMKRIRFTAVLKMRGIDKNIFAYSMKDLKGKGSKIANGYFNPVDVMTVVELDEVNNIIRSFSLTRINKKCPNGSIERGKWK